MSDTGREAGFARLPGTVPARGPDDVPHPLRAQDVPALLPKIIDGQRARR